MKNNKNNKNTKNTTKINLFKLDLINSLKALLSSEMLVKLYILNFIILISIGILMITPIVSVAATRNFAPRFQTTTTGNIAIIGNTLMSCQVVTVGDNCDQSRRGTATGATLNNNGFNMVPVDMDTDATTTNSSSAVLSIPSGSTVLFAGYYVSARSNAASRVNLKLDTPASPGYLNLTSQQDDFITTGQFEYQEYVDVTAQVAASPNGLYMGSAGAYTTGADKYAGWSLVVVYSNPAEPMRNLNVFDGFAPAPINIAIAGFKAPNSGVVNSQVGIVSFEGDRGTTGDKATLNGVDLTNTLNPANNYFNSTITNNNVNVPNTIPNLVNTLGMDIDVVNTNGIITPGSTSTNLVLSTTGDAFYTGVATFAIEVQAPKVQVTKTMVDVNGDDLMIGDILDVTLNVNSNGLDAASNTEISDVIDPNLIYVPNSINYTSGLFTGTKTDSVDPDQACYNSATTTLKFALGTGAANCTGGLMGIGTTSTIKFQVTVKSGLNNGQLVANTSTAKFTSAILNQNYTGQSNTVSLPVKVPPTQLTGSVYSDLNANAIQDVSELGLGSIVVNLRDPVTNNIVYSTTTLPDGTWSLSTIPAQYKVEVIAPPGKIVTGSTNNNIVTSVLYQVINAGKDGINDLSDVSIAKVSCGSVVQGSTCNYTLSVTNGGQGIVRKKVIIQDTLPAGLTYNGFAQITTGYIWTCTTAGQIVTCELDQDIPAGVTVQMIIKTKVN